MAIARLGMFGMYVETGLRDRIEVLKLSAVFGNMSTGFMGYKVTVLRVLSYRETCLLDS